MKRFAVLALASFTTPAFAHFGDHTHFDMMGLLEHVFETDHIVFATIAVFTGIFAYRAGKKAGLKQKGDA